MFITIEVKHYECFAPLFPSSGAGNKIIHLLSSQMDGEGGNLQTNDAAIFLLVRTTETNAWASFNYNIL